MNDIEAESNELQDQAEGEQLRHWVLLGPARNKTILLSAAKAEKILNEGFFCYCLFCRRINLLFLHTHALSALYSVAGGVAKRCKNVQFDQSNTRIGRLWGKMSL